MKGSEGIASLKLETLNKLISKFPKAPSMSFSSKFPSTQYESDTIRWEVEYGSAGMTPFVAPGSTAPTVGVDGVGEASAVAAYYKEKMYFDEEYLNNLRQPGQWATYQTAERKLARGLQKLNYRCDRRREWMMAKMFIDGGFTYIKQGGIKFQISYGIPAQHRVTLGGTRLWTTGNAKNPIEDVFDAKTLIGNNTGISGSELTAMCNSNVLKMLLMDAGMRAVLAKSAFGEGDLFRDPSRVLGTLLGVGPLEINDDQYEVPGWLTGNVVGGATTVINVDDVSDFEAGGTLRFHDLSQPNVWEDETIVSVDVANSTVTVDTAPALSFVGGRDKVTMKKKYIPDNAFLMYATNYDGIPIAEFMEAPYGMQRQWGKFVDKKDEWDPDGVWIRVQDKGLPVLYHPDCIFTYFVA